MVHRMQQQDDDRWVAVDDEDGRVVAGPNPSHRLVVELFRNDPEFGNDIPLLSDYRGMD